MGYSKLNCEELPPNRSSVSTPSIYIIPSAGRCVSSTLRHPALELILKSVIRSNSAEIPFGSCAGCDSNGTDWVSSVGRAKPVQGGRMEDFQLW